MDRHHDVTAGGVHGLLGILIECIQGQSRNRCRINTGSYNPIGEPSGQNIYDLSNRRLIPALSHPTDVSGGTVI